LICAALVVVAMLIGLLTWWYWRRTDPKRRPNPRNVEQAGGAPAETRPA
jgi:hypothetical protein